MAESPIRAEETGILARLMGGEHLAVRLSFGAAPNHSGGRPGLVGSLPRRLLGWAHLGEWLLMPIRVVCSVCQQASAAPESLAGRSAPCPSCGTAVLIPAFAAPPPLAPAPLAPQQPARALPPRTLQSAAFPHQGTSGASALVQLWLVRGLGLGWLGLGALALILPAIGISSQRGEFLASFVLAFILLLVFAVVSGPVTGAGLALLHFGLKPSGPNARTRSQVLVGAGSAVTLLGYLLSGGMLWLSIHFATAKYKPHDHPENRADRVARAEKDLQEQLTRVRKAEPECWSQIRRYESVRHNRGRFKDEAKASAEVAAEEYFDALKDVKFAWHFLQDQVRDNQVESALLTDPKLIAEIAAQQAVLDKIDDIRFDPAARVEIFFDNLMER